MAPSTPATSDPARPAGDLRLAGALAAACAWNLTSMGAIADDLAAALGTGLATVGLLGAVLWLPHALSQLPSGRVIDRLGTRRVGAAALVGLLASNAAAALAPDVALVGATRLVAGASCGAGSLCAIVYARGPTAVGQGIVGSATSAGAAAPLALIPVAAPLLGWRAPFALGALLALAVLVAFLAGAPDDRHALAARPLHAAVGMRALLLDPVLSRLSVLLGALTMLSWTMGNWIVPLLARDGRFGAVLAGLLGALIFAGGIVARPLGAWIASHTRVAGGAMIAGCLLLGAAAVAVVAAGAPVWLVALAVAGLGLTASMPWAVILHAAGSARPGEAAAGVGVVGMEATLAAVASIPLFGLAFDTGHETLALVCLAVVAAVSTFAVPAGRGLDGRRAPLAVTR
ncbi:MAG TPA: MFS transporter [Solirubrobacteraceae bacterium]|nr:MFS transporter [Solirubrobacteraceae bacterium]